MVGQPDAADEAHRGAFGFGDLVAVERLEVPFPAVEELFVGAARRPPNAAVHAEQDNFAAE